MFHQAQRPQGGERLVAGGDAAGGEPPATQAGGHQDQRKQDEGDTLLHEF